MAAKDIHIYESGNGGEMEIVNGDLLLTDTIYQAIYLALFGGNTEENSEWWGNELFYPNEESKWLISETERVLNNTPLNSQGRETIETAVKTDLEFLKEIINIEVNVSIKSENAVKIEILIRDFDSDVNLEIIWNNLKNELVIDKII